MSIVSRHMQTEVVDALEWARVIMLHGARQSGKTTMARAIAKERSGTYVSLDDDELRADILDDPRTFLASQPYPLVLDEAQRGGDRLVFAIKRLVDEENTPGRFILTGSTNFLTVSNLSESLAGRVIIFRLWPFSQAEMADTRPAEIDSWFEGDVRPLPVTPADRLDYWERVCRGGYAEAVALSAARRRRWHQEYLETVIQRDIAELADIRNAPGIFALLKWAAGLTSGQISQTKAAQQVGISRPAASKYFGWLQTVFLAQELPAWTRSLTSSAARRPKFHISDSGLAASLLGEDPRSLSAPGAPATGPLLETFAVNEISRLLSASPEHHTLSHYRDKTREIDLIIQNSGNDVVAVEIKATSSPAAQHMSHLRWFRDKLDSVSPGTFRAGILLHTGPYSVRTEDRLHMRPVNCLWAP